MPFNANEIVSALISAAAEVHEVAERFQTAVCASGKAQLEALETKVKDEIANKLMNLLAKLGK